MESVVKKIGIYFKLWRLAATILIAMAAFLGLCLLATWMQVTESVRPASHPPRDTAHSGPVRLEVFLDLLCPDSRDTWRDLQKLERECGAGKLDLVVRLTALPYHRWSYLASQVGNGAHNSGIRNTVAW